MSKQTIYRFGDYALNASRLQLSNASGEVRLEPQVIRLLILLVSNSHRVVTKEEINEKIWNGRVVSDASLASRLRAARSAIGDSGSEQRLIRTLPNVGVQFVGEVTTTELSPGSFLSRIFSVVRDRPVACLSVAVAVVLFVSGGWYLGWERPTQQLRAQFDKVPDAAIRYYNHKKLRNTTVENCMRECIRTTEFTCRSFDFYKRLDVCDLSAATADSVGGLKTDYELDPYDHYARKSYPPGPIELGRDDSIDPVDPAEPFTDVGVTD